MLLVQNTKMKKSSQNGLVVVNWTIPAFLSQNGFRTCPQAGACAKGCYARSGTYLFSNVRRAHESKLALTQQDDFASVMISEIDLWLKKRSVKQLKIRIHDSGDFYDLAYVNKWLEVMRHFKSDFRVSFYAYTKQVKLFKQLTQLGAIPANFTLIYSFGGKQDALIDVNTDRHSRVFESIELLTQAGYVNGTIDDMVAAMGESNKVGLVFHHAKKWSNTAWDRVA